jgi:cation diffusion facilitator CzcD-associated flavoprotein CzcO
MEQLATTARPLRIAIIGAGPAGLYAAEELLKQRTSVIALKFLGFQRWEESWWRMSEVLKCKRKEQ